MRGRFLRVALAIVCGGIALDLVALRQFTPKASQPSESTLRVDSYHLPDLLRRVRQDGVLLVDCRTPEQLAQRTIPGAVPFEVSKGLHPRLKIFFDAGNSGCPGASCSTALANARAVNETTPFSAAFYPGGWAEWTTAFPTPADEPSYMRSKGMP